MSLIVFLVISQKVAAKIPNINTKAHFMKLSSKIPLSFLKKLLYCARKVDLKLHLSQN